MQIETCKSGLAFFLYFDNIRNMESDLAINADRMAALGNEARLGILKLLLRLILKLLLLLLLEFVVSSSFLRERGCREAC